MESQYIVKRENSSHRTGANISAASRIIDEHYQRQQSNGIRDDGLVQSLPPQHPSGLNTDSQNQNNRTTTVVMSTTRTTTTSPIVTARNSTPLPPSSASLVAHSNVRSSSGIRTSSPSVQLVSKAIVADAETAPFLVGNTRSSILRKRHGSALKNENFGITTASSSNTDQHVKGASHGQWPLPHIDTSISAMVDKQLQLSTGMNTSHLTKGGDEFSYSILHHGYDKTATNSFQTSVTQSFTPSHLRWSKPVGEHYNNDFQAEDDSHLIENQNLMPLTNSLLRSSPKDQQVFLSSNSNQSSPIRKRRLVNGTFIDDGDSGSGGDYYSPTNSVLSPATHERTNRVNFQNPLDLLQPKHINGSATTTSPSSPQQLVRSTTPQGELHYGRLLYARSKEADNRRIAESLTNDLVVVSSTSAGVESDTSKSAANVTQNTLDLIKRQMCARQLDEIATSMKLNFDNEGKSRNEIESQWAYVVPFLHTHLECLKLFSFLEHCGTITSYLQLSQRHADHELVPSLLRSALVGGLQVLIETGTSDNNDSYSVSNLETATSTNVSSLMEQLRSKLATHTRPSHQAESSDDQNPGDEFSPFRRAIESDNIRRNTTVATTSLSPARRRIVSLSPSKALVQNPVRTFNNEINETEISYDLYREREEEDRYTFDQFAVMKASSIDQPAVNSNTIGGISDQQRRQNNDRIAMALEHIWKSFVNQQPHVKPAHVVEEGNSSSTADASPPTSRALDFEQSIANNTAKYDVDDNPQTKLIGYRNPATHIAALSDYVMLISSIVTDTTASLIATVESEWQGRLEAESTAAKREESCFTLARASNYTGKSLSSYYNLDFWSNNPPYPKALLAMLKSQSQLDLRGSHLPFPVAETTDRLALIYEHFHEIELASQKNILPFLGNALKELLWIQVEALPSLSGEIKEIEKKVSVDVDQTVRIAVHRALKTAQIQFEDILSNIDVLHQQTLKEAIDNVKNENYKDFAVTSSTSMFELKDMAQGMEDLAAWLYRSIEVSEELEIFVQQVIFESDEMRDRHRIIVRQGEERLKLERAFFEMVSANQLQHRRILLVAASNNYQSLAAYEIKMREFQERRQHENCEQSGYLNLLVAKYNTPKPAEIPERDTATKTTPIANPTSVALMTDTNLHHIELKSDHLIAKEVFRRQEIELLESNCRLELLSALGGVVVSYISEQNALMAHSLAEEMYNNEERLAEEKRLLMQDLNDQNQKRHRTQRVLEEAENSQRLQIILEEFTSQGQQMTTPLLRRLLQNSIERHDVDRIVDTQSRELSNLHELLERSDATAMEDIRQKETQVADLHHMYQLCASEADDRNAITTGESATFVCQLNEAKDQLCYIQNKNFASTRYITLLTSLEAAEMEGRRDIIDSRGETLYNTAIEFRSRAPATSAITLMDSAEYTNTTSRTVDVTETGSQTRSADSSNDRESGEQNAQKQFVSIINKVILESGESEGRLSIVNEALETFVNEICLEFIRDIPHVRGATDWVVIDKPQPVVATTGKRIPSTPRLNESPRSGLLALDNQQEDNRRNMQMSQAGEYFDLTVLFWRGIADLNTECTRTALEREGKHFKEMQQTERERHESNLQQQITASQDIENRAAERLVASESQVRNLQEENEDLQKQLRCQEEEFQTKLNQQEEEYRSEAKANQDRSETETSERLSSMQAKFDEQLAELQRLLEEAEARTREATDKALSDYQQHKKQQDDTACEMQQKDDQLAELAEKLRAAENQKLLDDSKTLSDHQQHKKQKDDTACEMQQKDDQLTELVEKIRAAENQKLLDDSKISELQNELDEVINVFTEFQTEAGSHQFEATKATGENKVLRSEIASLEAKSKLQQRENEETKAQFETEKANLLAEIEQMKAEVTLLEVEFQNLSDQSKMENGREAHLASQEIMRHKEQIDRLSRDLEDALKALKDQQVASSKANESPFLVKAPGLDAETQIDSEAEIMRLILESRYKVSPMNSMLKRVATEKARQLHSIEDIENTIIAQQTTTADNNDTNSSMPRFDLTIDSGDSSRNTSRTQLVLSPGSGASTTSFLSPTDGKQIKTRARVRGSTFRSEGIVPTRVTFNETMEATSPLSISSAAPVLTLKALGYLSQYFLTFIPALRITSASASTFSGSPSGSFMSKGRMSEGIKPEDHGKKTTNALQDLSDTVFMKSLVLESINNKSGPYGRTKYSHPAEPSRNKDRKFMTFINANEVCASVNVVPSVLVIDLFRYWLVELPAQTESEVSPVVGKVCEEDGGDSANSDFSSEDGDQPASTINNNMANSYSESSSGNVSEIEDNNNRVRSPSQSPRRRIQLNPSNIRLPPWSRTASKHLFTQPWKVNGETYFDIVHRERSETSSKSTLGNRIDPSQLSSQLGHASSFHSHLTRSSSKYLNPLAQAGREATIFNLHQLVQIDVEIDDSFSVTLHFASTAIERRSKDHKNSSRSSGLTSAASVATANVTKRQFFFNSGKERQQLLDMLYLVCPAQSVYCSIFTAAHDITCGNLYNTALAIGLQHLEAQTFSHQAQGSDITSSEKRLLRSLLFGGTNNSRSSASVFSASATLKHLALYSHFNTALRQSTTGTGERSLTAASQHPSLPISFFEATLYADNLIGSKSSDVMNNNEAYSYVTQRWVPKFVDYRLTNTLSVSKKSVLLKWLEASYPKLQGARAPTSQVLTLLFANSLIDVSHLFPLLARGKVSGVSGDIDDMAFNALAVQLATVGRKAEEQWKAVHNTSHARCSALKECFHGTDNSLNVFVSGFQKELLGRENTTVAATPTHCNALRHNLLSTFGPLRSADVFSPKSNPEPSSNINNNDVLLKMAGIFHTPNVATSPVDELKIQFVQLPQVPISAAIHEFDVIEDRGSVGSRHGSGNLRSSSVFGAVPSATAAPRLQPQQIPLPLRQANINGVPTDTSGPSDARTRSSSTFISSESLGTTKRRLVVYEAASTITSTAITHQRETSGEEPCKYNNLQRMLATHIPQCNPALADAINKQAKQEINGFLKFASQTLANTDRLVDTSIVPMIHQSTPGELRYLDPKSDTYSSLDMANNTSKRNQPTPREGVEVKDPVVVPDDEKLMVQAESNCIVLAVDLSIHVSRVDWSKADELSPSLPIGILRDTHLSDLLRQEVDNYLSVSPDGSVNDSHWAVACWEVTMESPLYSPGSSLETLGRRNALGLIMVASKHIMGHMSKLECAEMIPTKLRQSQLVEKAKEEFYRAQEENKRTTFASSSILSTVTTSLQYVGRKQYEAPILLKFNYNCVPIGIIGIPTILLSDAGVKNIESLSTSFDALHRISKYFSARQHPNPLLSTCSHLFMLTFDKAGRSIRGKHALFTHSQSTILSMIESSPSKLGEAMVPTFSTSQPSVLFVTILSTRSISGTLGVDVPTGALIDPNILLASAATMSEQIANLTIQVPIEIKNKATLERLVASTTDIVQGYLAPHIMMPSVCKLDSGHLNVEALLNLRQATGPDPGSGKHLLGNSGRRIFIVIRGCELNYYGEKQELLAHVNKIKLVVTSSILNEPLNFTLERKDHETQPNVFASPTSVPLIAQTVSSTVDSLLGRPWFISVATTTLTMVHSIFHLEDAILDQISNETQFSTVNVPLFSTEAEGGFMVIRLEIIQP